MDSFSQVISKILQPCFQGSGLRYYSQWFAPLVPVMHALSCNVHMVVFRCLCLWTYGFWLFVRMYAALLYTVILLHVKLF